MGRRFECDPRSVGRCVQRNQVGQVLNCSRFTPVSIDTNIVAPAAYGRVKSPSREPDLYHREDRLKRDGLTTTVCPELSALLAPRVSLKNCSIGTKSLRTSTNPPAYGNECVGNWYLPLKMCIPRCVNSRTNIGAQHWHCSWMTFNFCCAARWTCCANWAKQTTTASAGKGCGRQAVGGKRGKCGAKKAWCSGLGVMRHS